MYFQVLQDNDYTYEIEITPGNYSTTSLATEIKNEIENLNRNINSDSLILNDGNNSVLEKSNNFSCSVNINQFTDIFSISLFSFNFLKSKKSKIISIFLGPYILFVFIFQSGFITDRTRDLRLASESLIQSENLNKKYIDIVKKDINDEISHSKIIKILLQMPNLGNEIESLDDLKKDQYAWSRFSNDEFKNRQDIILINNDDIFSPWKLLLKK